MSTHETITAETALTQMLRPITWHMASGVTSRQNLVTARRNQVYTAYPFLTHEMKVRADKWLVDEAHTGLWD